MSVIAMSVIDELEGLLREARSTPWEYAEDPNEIADGARIYGAERKHWVSGGGYMMDRVDARLIVAAVNALPNLLAVARAAMAFERDPVPDENWKRLWAAVAALRASSPSGGGR
jgi:hypothetical protein